MYKYYRAYSGKWYDSHDREGVGAALKEINDNDEEIVSVVPVGEGGIYVLIITKTRPHDPIFEGLL